MHPVYLQIHPVDWLVVLGSRCVLLD